MVEHIIYTLIHTIINIYHHNYIQVNIFLYISNNPIDTINYIYDHNIEFFHISMCMEDEISRNIYHNYQYNYDRKSIILYNLLYKSINLYISNQHILFSSYVYIFLKLFQFIHYKSFSYNPHNILKDNYDRILIFFRIMHNIFTNFNLNNKPIIYDHNYLSLSQP